MRLTECRHARPPYDPALHDTKEVLERLTLEPLGPLRFRGRADTGRPRLFGGLLVGQALMAALQTTSRRPHALHALFIDSGKPMAVDYTVEILRDGGTFGSRRVVASQQGRPVLQMLASFQDEEAGLSHQDPFPWARDQDKADLVAWGPRWRSAALRDGRPFHRASHEFYTAGWDPYGNAQPDVARHIWARSPLALEDGWGRHEALFAYLSDYCLLFSALQPHGIGRAEPGLRCASLDHSIWFHRPLRADDWLLLAMRSPRAAGGRGLCESAVYDVDGGRVATVMQEALIRLR